ncbi:hypothetical protein ACFLT9_01380 [Acidobacteriota bacterium]
MKKTLVSMSIVLLIIMLFSDSHAFSVDTHGDEDISDKKKVSVISGAQYRAGGLARLILGSEYRKLWTMPIEVEVLDMKKEAGGLTPVMRVGGNQTKGLAIKGKNGRSYTFRGIDKNPAALLPPLLQNTVASKLVQDQISSAHPASPMIAESIMAAAGVLHMKVRLVVLPDDPALGEFREDFKGILGTFQEYPTPASDSYEGFAGATEIQNHSSFLKRLKADPVDRIDSRAYLKARLLDIFMGDWDRHHKQWNWAKIPGQSKWQPIPEDRDQAFSRYDGLVLALARVSSPYFQNFSSKYQGIFGMTLFGWDLDRTILPDLERSDWESVAEDLRARLTDGVIEEAARRLPPEYYEIDGERLATALKNRRDKLPDMADKYYDHLARCVDIYMTDRDESVEISPVDKDRFEVRVSLISSEKEPSSSPPYYRRVFNIKETRELRIYLKGGDDLLDSKLENPPGLTIRVICGPGSDNVVDSATGNLRVFNTSGNHKVKRGGRTTYDWNDYTPPYKHENYWIPYREWGRDTIPIIWIGGGPDLGFFFGGGFTKTAYGFRKYPYSSQQSFRLGYATSAQTFRMDYNLRLYRTHSRNHVDLQAQGSGLEIMRFYGFGNESSSLESDDFYKVQQREFSLSPSLTMYFTDKTTLTLGPTIKYSRTILDQTSFIKQSRPYGAGHFGQVGLNMSFRFDSRNRNTAASKGLELSLEGQFYPKMWDVEKAFFVLRANTSLFLSVESIAFKPTLALRVGGKKLFGSYPFHEAAFIGGGGLTGTESTVRGFRPQRFAGDSSLYGNAELRIRLSRITLFLPGEIGLFGLYDIGRVYFQGETSNTWHTAVGGGIWISILKPEYTLSLSLAKSDERTGIYLSGGFLF